MSSSAAVPRITRLGDFELDLQSGELRSGGRITRLPEQAFRILVVLLERPGEVVTREELRNRVWTAETFVDFDTGLNSAMRKLREALGDSAEHPRFIETLPRRGYRLIAPIDAPPADGAPADSRVSRRRALIAIVLAFMLLAVGVAASRFGRPAPPRITSLAVLPMTNLTADAGQDYFADGMTDALITELSRLPEVRVISRTSSMQYRDGSKTLPQIAKELNVDGIVLGTVVRSGSRVRLTAQLIHAPADRRLWMGSYDRELGDILILQRDLAQAVVTAVRAERGENFQGRKPAPPIDPRAYDSFLRSHIALGKSTNAGLEEAIAYVEDATARQPDFAAAWAAMARYYLQAAVVGLLTPQECLRRAEVAARTALELDPMLPQAHTAQGVILSRRKQWVEAEREFRRAIDLAPSDANARRPYSTLLANQGRSAEALREARRAVALDPLFVQGRLALAQALRDAGLFDEAVASYQKALAMDPNAHRARYQLGRTYLETGKVTAAIAELETAVERSNRNLRYVSHLGYAYGRAGRSDDAREILAELRRETRYVSPVGLALVHTGLGDREAALAALEKGYEEQALELSELMESPAFDSLSDEPRFQQLLTKVRMSGLPQNDSRAPS